jgi:hypothetical protein
MKEKLAEEEKEKLIKTMKMMKAKDKPLIAHEGLDSAKLQQIQERWTEIEALLK